MSSISLFEEKQVRRAWNADEEKWLFSIVDVVAILTGSVDPGAYWRKHKERLKKEGNETVTDCHGLKMTAADGKQRMTDVADTEQLLRLIQSIPSPKAEPFKLWLAKVGYERLEEIENPELAAKRMRAIYEQKGYSEDWIEKRLPATPLTPTAGASREAAFGALLTALPGREPAALEAFEFQEECRTTASGDGTFHQSDQPSAFGAQPRELRYRHRFYDALIAAAAMEADVPTLYSEDLRHGRRFGPLTILNPFSDQPRAAEGGSAPGITNNRQQSTTNQPPCPSSNAPAGRARFTVARRTGSPTR